MNTIKSMIQKIIEIDGNINELSKKLDEKKEEEKWMKD